MNSSIDNILDVKNTGGVNLNKDRSNGTMQREISRILDRNSKRDSYKHAGIRHIQCDLKQRGIYAGRAAVRNCLRKDLGTTP